MHSTLSRVSGESCEILFGIWQKACWKLSKLGKRFSGVMNNRTLARCTTFLLFTLKKLSIMLITQSTPSPQWSMGVVGSCCAILCLLVVSLMSSLPSHWYFGGNSPQPMDVFFFFSFLNNGFDVAPWDIQNYFRSFTAIGMTISQLILFICK